MLGLIVDSSGMPTCRSSHPEGCPGVPTAVHSQISLPPTLYEMVSSLSKTMPNQKRNTETCELSTTRSSGQHGTCRDRHPSLRQQFNHERPISRVLLRLNQQKSWVITDCTTSIAFSVDFCGRHGNGKTVRQLRIYLHKCTICLESCLKTVPVDNEG